MTLLKRGTKNHDVTVFEILTAKLDIIRVQLILHMVRGVYLLALIFRERTTLYRTVNAVTIHGKHFLVR